MRILNQLEFTTTLTNQLADLDVYTEYKTWLKDSVLKWLLKNSPEFVSTFTTPLVAQKSAMIEGMVSYFYLDLDGRKQSARGLTEFDKKDAAAKTLNIFVPKKNLLTWMFRQHPVLIEARDFFLELYEQKPDTDLRKYTIDTLERSLATWRVEREARMLRLRQQELARLEAAHAAAADAERAILESLTSEDETLRQQQLTLAWSRFIEGEDYINMGQIGDLTVFNLLTPRALDWESSFKGNCLNGSGYKRQLQDGKSLILSVRRTETPAVALYSMEVHYTKTTIEMYQCEHWGYKKMEWNQFTDRKHMAQAEIDTQKFLLLCDRSKFMSKTREQQRSSNEFFVRPLH